MAIDIATTKAVAIAAIKASLKTAMNGAYGEPEATYDEFAGIVADAVGEGIEDTLDEIKTNAVAKNGTAGPDDLDID